MSSVVLLFAGVAMAGAQIIVAFRQLDMATRDPFKVSMPIDHANTAFDH